MLPTYRDNLSLPIFRGREIVLISYRRFGQFMGLILNGQEIVIIFTDVSRQPLKMEPIGIPKMLVKNYHNTLCNIPEVCSFHLLRSGSLNSSCISELNVATVKHLTVLIANRLSTWSRVFPEELTGSQAAKKFPVFYGTGRFMTTFTKAHHISLSC